MRNIYSRIVLVLCLGLFFSNLYSQNKYVKGPSFNAAFQTDKFFIDGKGGIDFSVSQPDGKILVIHKTYGYVVGGDSYNVVRINPDNSIDPSFTTAAFDKEVKSVTLQNDGKIIVAGAFNFHNNVAANYIIRLNADGTKDNTFTAGTFAFQQFAVKKELEKVVVQPDGKILICGNITSYNTVAVNSMVRLNSNGSIDTTFLASTTYTTDISHFALQPDGKIIVVYSGSYLKRLNADGTDDTSFYIYTGGTFTNIRSVVVRNDGKIYVGGKGVFFGNTQYLNRLNSDGYKDTAFVTKAFYQNFPPNSSSNGVFALLIQADGKLLVGGNFISYGGQPVAGIMRLNDDATLDTTFAGKITHLIDGYSYQDHIDNLSFHSSGNIIATGFIKYYNGDFAGNIVMTDPVNGNRIPSFQNICKGFDRAPAKIYVQPDGKIILTGNFYSYNGKVADRIVRLNADGTVDNSFNVPSYLFLDGSSHTPAGIKFLPDGKILVGTEGTAYLNRNGGGVVRLNSDGSLDPTFFSLLNNDLGLMGSLRLRDFIVFNDGKLLTPGMYYYLKNNVSTSIDYSFVALNSAGNIDASIDYAEPFTEILKVKLLSNGKILVTGYSTSNGNGTIKRLLSNGQIDNSFVTVTSQPFITEIFPAADGKIYAISNRILGHKLMRFNEDGTLDNTFIPQSFNDGMVTKEETLEFENNGKFFTALPVAASQKGLVRHNADGTYDNSFDIGTGFQNPFPTIYSDVVSTIKRQGDNFLVGGEFRNFDVRGLVRLIPQSSLNVKEQQSGKKQQLIYPNPTTGIINIKAEEYSQYEVTDHSGRTIIPLTKIQPTIDVSHLSTGIYYLLLKNGKETSLQKFIKK